MRGRMPTLEGKEYSYQETHPSESLPPRIYWLSKIRKPEVPLRPKVSAIRSSTHSLAKHLAYLLTPHRGNSIHHIQNSQHFLRRISVIQLKPMDMLMSFDVESLFTSVPLATTINLLAPLFPPKIIKIFNHCLSTNYFSYQGQFYEQLEGLAMGIPLSPAVANLFVEHFEKTALDSAPLKPTHWCPIRS